MKIAFFSIPAYGHTNPTLALVKALSDNGHKVYYFSFDIFKKSIEEAGAEYISCDGYDFEMEDKGNAARVGKDMVFATKLLVSSTLALDEMAGMEIRRIKPDVIISDSVAYWGKLTAWKYNIPYISSTTTFAFNRYSAKYIKESFWDIIRMIFSLSKINKEIKRLRGKGYPVKGLLDIIQNDNETNTIVYTSKYFQPCSETFSSRYHFIGPSIRPVRERMEKRGEKTIYISMGTVNNDSLFYRNVITALSSTPWQVIISMGTNREHFDNLSSNIQVYDTVDQMAVLSIADAFITHAGMNSVSEALYFTVPLVLFPQTPEQGAVARRVEETGAGIALKSISPDDILSSLDEVINNPVYKENAEKISSSFHSSGGMKEAVEFIESVKGEE